MLEIAAILFGSLFCIAILGFLLWAMLDGELDA